MKRVSALFAFSLLCPAFAAAQIVPPTMPVPVAKPAPMPQVTIPVTPLPPMPAVAPDIETLRAALARVEATQPTFRAPLDNLQFYFDQGGGRGVAAPNVLRMDSSSGSDAYSSGLSAMNSGNYDRAIERFDQVINMKGTRIEGALYWKAYSQYKVGKIDESQTTVNELRKTYAQSPYMTDAKTLELELKKLQGRTVDPATLNDDDLKLAALQGLMQSDPAGTIPQLDNFLKGSSSLRVKKNALYLLALSNEASAHPLLLKYAKGAGNPDLQREAINYLATRRSGGVNKTTYAELREIYESTTDVETKAAIIDAFRGPGSNYTIAYSNFATPMTMFPSVGGGRGVSGGSVAGAASGSGGGGGAASATSAGGRGANANRTTSTNTTTTTNTTVTPRAAAATAPVAAGGRGGGRGGGPASNTPGDPAAISELWTLYQKETNTDLRLRMVRAFASLNAVDQLMQILKSEKDPNVRSSALQNVARMSPDKTGTILVEMYTAETDKNSRRQIISSLASQNNAEGLVAIARKEPSLDLKTEIVRRLSDMAPRSKVAADYLMEIIK